MTLNSNEHRIIIAALETYQSMWAVAVTEAQRENEPIDERFTRERYVEAGELLAKFRKDPEGADTLAMVGKLDANVAAEQARDGVARQRGLAGLIYEQTTQNVRPWAALGVREQEPFLEAAKSAQDAVKRQIAEIARVANALRLYYLIPGRENGGAVHIITEDGNTEQEHADWCVENAPTWAAKFGGDAYLASDLFIARMVAALTDEQRRTLYDTGVFRPEEPGEDDLRGRALSAARTGDSIRIELDHTAARTLDRLDHNLDDLRSDDEEMEEQ